MKDLSVKQELFALITATLVVGFFTCLMWGRFQNFPLNGITEVVGGAVVGAFIRSRHKIQYGLPETVLVSAISIGGGYLLGVAFWLLIFPLIS